MGWCRCAVAALAVRAIACTDGGADSQDPPTSAAAPAPVATTAAPIEAPAPEAADTAPFTIVVLPDTQYYAKNGRPEFGRQVDWVIENRERANIAFVSQVGDLVQNGSRVRAEWELADEVMSRLDGVVPWAVVPGNHDYNVFNGCAEAADAYAKHFGPERFEEFDWFGGASPSGLSTYQVVDAGWRTMLFLHLEIDVPAATMAWAQRVIDEHPDLPTVVTTHVYLSCGLEKRWRRPHCNPKGSSAETTWRTLIRTNPQVFLVLSGHSPGEYHQVSENDAGTAVIEVAANYQTRKNGGDGWLRLVEVRPGDGRVEFRTYSPTRDEFETDADSAFGIDIDLEHRFSTELDLARRGG
jgi:hypothetical protein